MSAMTIYRYNPTSAHLYRSAFAAFFLSAGCRFHWQWAWLKLCTTDLPAFPRALLSSSANSRRQVPAMRQDPVCIPYGCMCHGSMSASHKVSISQGEQHKRAIQHAASLPRASKSNFKVRTLQNVTRATSTHQHGSIEASGQLPASLGSFSTPCKNNISSHERLCWCWLLSNKLLILARTP